MSVESIRSELAPVLPRLRRFARALTRNRDDADDLVQLAVERALRNAAQWQAGTQLHSWMFRIMQNAWIDELRSRQRREIAVAPEELEGEAEGVAAPGDAADALAVRQAVAQLSDEQRVVVALVLVEGLPYKEAAEVLEIPIGTLTSRLARARTVLQQLLGGTAGSPA